MWEYRQWWVVPILRRWFQSVEKKVAEQIRWGNLEKKSLFRITAYRQSLNEIRVGLQDKRPKAEAETMVGILLTGLPYLIVWFFKPNALLVKLYFPWPGHLPVYTARLENQFWGAACAILKANIDFSFVIQMGKINCPLFKFCDFLVTLTCVRQTHASRRQISI